MTILSFDAILKHFSEKRALVVGDVMLDRFVYGSVKRISPEAPTAVINASRPQDTLGGAANVANNIIGMSAECSLLGVVGVDEAASRFLELIRKSSVVPRLITAEARHTTVKMRFVANLHNTHLLRADWEDSAPLELQLEDQLLQAFDSAVSAADVIILSDYRKGALTPRVIEEIIARSRELGKLVVADPKGEDYRRYRGVTTLTPNVGEIAQALGRPVADEVDELAQAAMHLMDVVGCDFILVTRSEKGVLLVERSGSRETFPTVAERVVDVSGAGDTLIGSFALALAAGAEPRIAARLANTAAGIGVAKAGTSVVTHDELRRALLSRPHFEVDAKIIPDLDVLDCTVAEWRRAGLNVGFTNGCYDLLHPGHVHLLQRARASCDRLIVGLNTDASIQRLKGPTRPVQSEAARATVMAALAFVDAVVLFDEDTPIELIRRIRPQILIKGADYTMEQVVGREIVEAEGGKVVLIDLIPDTSTSGMIKRMANDEEPSQSRSKPQHQTVPVVARLGRSSSRWISGDCRPALFLDRDGVIIEDKGYVGRIRDVALLPGVAQAICQANKAGLPIVVASNQSGVARGMFGWGAVNEVDDAIGRILADEGAFIDLVLYCGAGPEAGSDPLECRKPAPGLFQLAARMLPVDLVRSVMIGDQLRDLEAAARAGLRRGVLVGLRQHAVPASDTLPTHFELVREADPAAAIGALVGEMAESLAAA